MKLREACVLTAYTGILLCNIDDFRIFLDKENAPDPFIGIGIDVKATFEELKARYASEFREIITSLEREAETR